MGLQIENSGPFTIVSEVHSVFKFIEMMPCKQQNVAI